MVELPSLTRRTALAGLTFSASVLPMNASLAAQTPSGPGRAPAAGQAADFRIATRSPSPVNAIAVNPAGTLFLGLPRLSQDAATPSVVRVEEDGTLAPFPGGAWNAWTPGASGVDAFVMVNALHVFDDGTLWVVDQGTADGREPQAGAQKLIRFDPRTGSLLSVLRFAADILPSGARLGDLRIHDQMLYVTDAGLGAIIVHDLVANRTIRRLSGQGDALVKGARIELSADGLWLYVLAPDGAVRRIATAALANPRFDDARLVSLIEPIASAPGIGGSAMDTQGNLYLCDPQDHGVAVLFADGSRRDLVRDARLSRPAGLFIDGKRRLYSVASPIAPKPSHGEGGDAAKAPCLVLVMDLPEALDGYPLGEAVTGRAPQTGLSNFYGIEHVAMTVPDHDEALRFLTEAFDATLLYTHIKKSDPPATAAQVGHINALKPGTKMLAASQIRFANGPNIEIFELEGYGRREAAGINDMGLVHFSVIVDDIAEAGARFEKAGGMMLGKGAFDLGFNEVGEGNQNWFGQTPWGTWVEFMTFRSPLRYDPGAVAERWFPRRG
ncbi:hypothetical protein MTR62_00870 [Novosphingobium sp. 1949]|uniref:VOC domain-containing protein n=1 Tax=Novosphingobium organovorum TaxID=2930092 RepID=A0ABT0B869_9SPHN|nr:L-dopachrome tautomerase-related protein [Novosphingobium organovorum]MCJ2181267.1 hypothetical protein [Novosphingobium organovorum]